MSAQPRLPRRKLFTDLQGYSGKESCIRTSEDDPNCKIVGNGTRHYAEWVNVEGTAWSGYRGPFCSSYCYRQVYVDDPRLESGL